MYGQLHNYETAEIIRDATIAELAKSLAAGPEGVIMVDGIACYVAGESDDAKAMALAPEPQVV